MVAKGMPGNRGAHDVGGAGRRPRSARGPTGPPDLAATAREAVVRYLQDASETTADLKFAPVGPVGAAKSDITYETARRTLVAERPAATLNAPERGGIAATEGETGRIFAAGTGTGGLAAPQSQPAVGAGDADAQSVALRAAAAGVATLDKIEAMAAKLETDIAAALQAQAELQAGAGAAAEAAIEAAQAAWLSADTAVKAEHRVRDSLRVISRQLVFTALLALIAIIILALFAASAR